MFARRAARHFCWRPLRLQSYLSFSLSLSLSLPAKRIRKEKEGEGEQADATRSLAAGGSRQTRSRWAIWVGRRKGGRGAFGEIDGIDTGVSGVEHLKLDHAVQRIGTQLGESD